MKAKTFFLQLVPDFFPTASFTPLAPICFSSTHSRNSEPPLASVCVPLNDTEVDVGEEGSTGPGLSQDLNPLPDKPH